MFKRNLQAKRPFILILIRYFPIAVLLLLLQPFSLKSLLGILCPCRFVKDCLDWCINRRLCAAISVLRLCVCVTLREQTYYTRNSRSAKLIRPHLRSHNKRNSNSLSPIISAIYVENNVAPSENPKNPATKIIDNHGALQHGYLTSPWNFADRDTREHGRGKEKPVVLEIAGRHRGL